MQAWGAAKNLGRDSAPHEPLAPSAGMLLDRKSGGGFGNALRMKKDLFASDIRLLKLFGAAVPLPGQLASQRTSSAGATTMGFNNMNCQGRLPAPAELKATTSGVSREYRGRPGSVIARSPTAIGQEKVRSRHTSNMREFPAEHNDSTPSMDMKRIQALSEELKAEVDKLTGGTMRDESKRQKVNEMERTTPESHTDVSKKEAEVLPALARLLQEEPPESGDSDATLAESRGGTGPRKKRKGEKRNDRDKMEIIREPTPVTLKKTPEPSELPTIQAKTQNRVKKLSDELNPHKGQPCPRQEGCLRPYRHPGHCRTKSSKSDAPADSVVSKVISELHMKRRRIFNRARRACARCHKRKIRCNPNPIHGAARPCASCLEEGRTDCCDYVPPQNAPSDASNVTGSPPRRKPKALADNLNRHRGTRCKRNPSCTRPHKHPGHCKDPGKKLQKFVGRFVKKRKRTAQSFPIPQAAMGPTPIAVQQVRPTINARHLVPARISSPGPRKHEDSRRALPLVPQGAMNTTPMTVHPVRLAMNGGSRPSVPLRLEPSYQSSRSTYYPREVEDVTGRGLGGQGGLHMPGVQRNNARAPVANTDASLLLGASGWIGVRHNS